MKQLLSISLIFLSTLNPFSVHAQANSSSIIISGKVTSFEESLGLEGVLISVKSTDKSTGTQADGTFNISVSPDDKMLVFKLDGYQTEEITISPKRNYDIILKRNGNSISSLLAEHFQQVFIETINDSIVKPAFKLKCINH